MYVHTRFTTAAIMWHFLRNVKSMVRELRDVFHFESALF